MGENSKIEWCDHTFNPWIGCQKVSPACDNCYAETMMDKRYGRVQWGPHGERKRTSAAYWRQPFKWNKEAGERGARYRVFCASLADVFDNQVPIEWLLELWRLIAETPHLDWLLLTKRPENFRRLLPPWLGCPDNVWLGVSIESANYWYRYDEIASIPCRMRFISYEPALGPLEIAKHATDARPLPDWIICGGESGPKARPMNPQWARDVRDQCMRLGIAFHFKQWGEWSPEPCGKSSGLRVMWTGSEEIYNNGKRASGRLLDGVEHNEFPSVNFS